MCQIHIDSDVGITFPIIKILALSRWLHLGSSLELQRNSLVRLDRIPTAIGGASETKEHQQKGG